MLTIVPTPLGNLKDITFRGVEALTEAGFIIAENPSYSKRLLDHYKIPKKELVQFADHNELKVLDNLIEKLKTQSACLITDAGTPGISDPGFRLVKACIENKIQIVALPGPNAAITALSASGLPTDKFIFFGFLGKTEPKVVKAIQEAKTTESTACFYESPERITKTISYITKNFPRANVVVIREISKIHEEYIRGTAEEVEKNLKLRQTIKGEITVILSFK